MRRQIIDPRTKRRRAPASVMETQQPSGRVWSRSWASEPRSTELGSVRIQHWRQANTPIIADGELEVAIAPPVCALSDALTDRLTPESSLACKRTRRSWPRCRCRRTHGCSPRYRAPPPTQARSAPRPSVQWVAWRAQLLPRAVACASWGPRAAGQVDGDGLGCALVGCPRLVAAAGDRTDFSSNTARHQPLQGSGNTSTNTTSCSDECGRARSSMSDRAVRVRHPDEWSSRPTTGLEGIYHARPTSRANTGAARVHHDRAVNPSTKESMHGSWQ